MRHFDIYLIFAGAIPFIVGLLCILLGIESLPILGKATDFFASYSLAIVSFLSGSLWGQHISTQPARGMFLQILSNAIVIVVWLAFLVLDFKSLLAVYGAIFLLLLIIDAWLYYLGFISARYFKARCWITALVVTLFCITRFVIT